MIQSNAAYEYLKNAVAGAGPEQLQLMLIDGAIRFTLRGREGAERRDIEAAFNGYERAQRIVLQIMEGLNREANPALVQQFLALFNFIYRRLIDASVKRDVVAADDALRILREQRETWALIVEKVAALQGDGSAAQPVAPASGVHEERPALSVEG